MLIVAIAHGNGCDPFTTSAVFEDNRAAELGFNPDDATQCLDFICTAKTLKREWIDEILVIYPPDYDEEAEVQHHHSEF